MLKFIPPTIHLISHMHHVFVAAAIHFASKGVQQLGISTSTHRPYSTNYLQYQAPASQISPCLQSHYILYFILVVCLDIYVRAGPGLSDIRCLSMLLPISF